MAVWDEFRGFWRIDGARTATGLNKIVDAVFASGRPDQLVGTVDSWLAENPGLAAIATADGITEGAVLFVPLVGSTGNVGSIIARHNVPVAFNGEEIRLLEGFADQAVIALDNARLFNSLEERNNDLAESLELQTATSEVLRLISAHPGDLRTVMRGLVERAANLVDADQGSAFRIDGDVAEFIVDTRYPDQIGRRFELTPALIAAFHDATAPMLFDDFQQLVRDGLLSPEVIMDLRTGISVVLRLDGEPYGSLNVNRHILRPFTAADARILQGFADQASIAISNAKLFNDLDAALARQTAMTEVLDAVSTARTDLQPVYDAVM